MSRPGGITQVRLSTPEVEELIERYKAGQAVGQLAASFGIHRGTVSKILTQSRIERRVALDDAGRHRAQELYAAGRSLADIGRELAAAPNTVRSALLALGVSVRPRPGARPL